MNYRVTTAAFHYVWDHKKALLGRSQAEQLKSALAGPEVKETKMCKLSGISS